MGEARGGGARIVSSRATHAWRNTYKSSHRFHLPHRLGKDHLRLSQLLVLISAEARRTHRSRHSLVPRVLRLVCGGISLDRMAVRNELTVEEERVVGTSVSNKPLHSCDL